MLRKLPLLAGVALTAVVMLATACKKPSPFGSEILTDDYGDYEFTDTITVECTLLREDAVNTSDKISAVPYFLCGEINDAVVGKYSSDIYSLLLAESLNPRFSDEVTFDSIVMYLKYAPAGVYGDTLKPQTLKVWRLEEFMDRDSSYYSNASIDAGEEIGRVEGFIPKINAQDSLFEGNEGAFLRVRLNDAFGRELLELDSLSWVSDSAFFKALRGIKITSSADGGAQPGAMLAFNLNDNALSRVALYYREPADTVQQRFDFYFRNSNKFTHFTHAYGAPDLAPNAEVFPFIGNKVEDKMYLQGMQGLKLRVSFPYANNLNNIAVNKAQLVFTIADEPAFLAAADQLVLTEASEDSTVYNYISDVLYALGSSGTGSLKLFGGFPEKELVNGTLHNRYRLALSEKFQHIIDDDANPDIKNRTVYVNVFPRNRSARRSVLYGPKSSTFPAKLELKYTRVR